MTDVTRSVYIIFLVSFYVLMTRGRLTSTLAPPPRMVHPKNCCNFRSLVRISQTSSCSWLLSYEAYQLKAPLSHAFQLRVNISMYTARRICSALKYFSKNKRTLNLVMLSYCINAVVSTAPRFQPAETSKLLHAYYFQVLLLNAICLERALKRTDLHVFKIHASLVWHNCTHSSSTARLAHLKTTKANMYLRNNKP